MSGISVVRKAERALHLLLGVRNPRVAGPLAACGFTQREYDQGWELLKGIAQHRLDPVPTRDDGPKLVKQMDAWENRWFPIARASLEFRYPEAHRYLFGKLHQTSGVDVLVGVGVFVERLAKLPKQRRVKNAAAARDLLERRGLDAEVIAEAQALLDRMGQLAPAPPPRVTPEQARAAEQALWRWYIEWSTIARTVITDRRLLRELGFRQARKGARRAKRKPATSNAGKGGQRAAASDGQRAAASDGAP